jgi:hypothetical protein
MWRLAADWFPCSTPIVDWYHASQPLSGLAQARFPADRQPAQAWREQLKWQLWPGECGQVIAQAQAAG